MLIGISAARRHHPPAIAESQTRTDKSFVKILSVRMRASNRTFAAPRNANRMASTPAVSVSGSFQKELSALRNCTLILFRWPEDKPGTIHSSNHFKGSSSCRTRLGLLKGLNAAGVLAQPPPSAISSSRLLTVTVFPLQWYLAFGYDW